MGLLRFARNDGSLKKDRKSLLVVPFGFFLWGVLSMMVARLWVPGSPFDVQYHLAGEILYSTISVIWITIFGPLLAVVYLTLYRRVYPKLPAGLRTETVRLTWKDLRLPGLLFTISVVLGLVIIL
jgi:hypothetical protein